MSSGYMKLTALDHRAAAQEKLEQFQPALSDAKKMIDLKPELSKVVLSCCSLAACLIKIRDIFGAAKSCN